MDLQAIYESQVLVRKPFGAALPVAAVRQAQEFEGIVLRMVSVGDFKARLKYLALRRDPNPVEDLIVTGSTTT